jgi:hypothetical protein
MIVLRNTAEITSAHPATASRASAPGSQVDQYASPPPQRHFLPYPRRAQRWSPSAPDHATRRRNA